MPTEHDPERERLEKELSTMRFSPARRRSPHRTGHSMDTFTRQMLETALWSSNDESDERGGEPLDKNYSVSDFDPKSLACLKRQAEKFQRENANALAEFGDDGQAGHYFWLSRNRSGAGFTDDDYKVSPALSAALKHLQRASQAAGEVDLYVGDDGQIYASGCEDGSPKKRRAKKRRIGKHSGTPRRSRGLGKKAHTAYAFCVAAAPLGSVCFSTLAKAEAYAKQVSATPLCKDFTVDVLDAKQTRLYKRFFNGRAQYIHPEGRSFLRTRQVQKLFRGSPKSHTRSAYRSGPHGSRQRIDLDEHRRLTESALGQRLPDADARKMQLHAWEQGRSPEATANIIRRAMRARSPRHGRRAGRPDAIGSLVHKVARKVTRLVTGKKG
jgi:hypothetical protein